MTNSLRSLIETEPVAVNVGLREFAVSLQQQGVRVVHVDWKPPLELDEETQEILDKLL
jgi:hypothetical protein